MEFLVCFFFGKHCSPNTRRLLYGGPSFMVESMVIINVYKFSYRKDSTFNLRVRQGKKV